MKGDFSRLTGLKAKRKHYNGVLKQQGRVQLDADWNELVSIISHQRKTRTIDTIGQCGAPIHNSGFEILHPGGGLNDLLITTGRFYSGGWLCETTPSSKLTINDIATDGSLAVDDISIDDMLLEIDQWVQVITDEHPDGIIGQLTVADGLLKTDQDLSSLVGDTHPYLRQLILFSEQPDFPLPSEYVPDENQTDIIYLDVWERHITTIEDPILREVALGGPDTDTRSKIITQVKVLQNVGDLECEDESTDWNELIKKSNGRLTTRLVVPDDPINPCQLGESGGFHGLENHLYRVEIHEDSMPGTATYKWSRDNAAYAYSINEFFPEPGGQVFKIGLKQNGKDDILKIKELDWIEVSGDETDLDTTLAGTLAKVVFVEGNVLTLDTDVAAHVGEAFPKIRRWEISNQRPTVTTAITPGTAYQLEDGIEIEFSGTEFKVGDYWVFSARTLTGEIELLEKEAPLGIKHHYCKLAMVTGLPGGDVDIEDCRPEFPPLTELPPGEGGCCTVIVGEDEDFQDIQPAIDFLAGGPGTVCIKPGVYIIDEPIQIKGRDITVKGCEGTAIIINIAESRDSGIIFQVQDSWDVVIHDLWCLSISGARVVEVENSLFFSIFNCMLVGAGTSDLGGVVTCQGLTINTRIADNLILGMIGVRYDSVVEQNLNIHVNARIERNITFVLENSLLQVNDAGIIGLDVLENLMMGISLNLMSKTFFPETLFKSVEEKQIHDSKDIEQAKLVRKKGEEFDSIRKGNTQPVFNLNNDLKTESVEIKAKREIVSAVALPTGKPVVSLSEALVDANFTDNILIGKAGISMGYVVESKIDSNLIITQLAGISCGVFEGLTIKENFVSSGTAAIACTGQVAMSLSLENNRLVGQTNGVEFSEGREPEIQVVWNAQINNNWITAKQSGISINNEGIILQDLTVTDNTFIECQKAGIFINAFDENQYTEKDDLNFQRVIQRNSINVKGMGIVVNISDTKILDNDITLNHEPNLGIKDSYGVVLLAGNSIIANNSIHAMVDVEQEKLSRGGVFLALQKELSSTQYHHIAIKDNKITGGIGNGVEIASDITGLEIRGNQIESMGLNGIAAQDQVSSVNDLHITGNHIHHCHQLAGKYIQWWAYGGIVLTATHNAQITDNIITDNGNALNHQTTFISAFYAERINNISISNNQFINNEVPGILNQQAVIHIPIVESLSDTNSDIRINNNLVKSTLSPSLNLGHFVCFNLLDIRICFGIDNKVVITANHFESDIAGPIVNLQASQCVLSDNYISSDPDNSASLGFGIAVMANGNVVSDPITGAGFNQQIINTLEF